MEKLDYAKLLNNYISYSTKICINKCCGYRFMFVLNNNATLSDMYNYVIQFYSHVTEPILLYVDKEHKKIVPNNNILLSKYLCENNILSCTQLNEPVVYEFHLDICSKHKNIYNQHYNDNNEHYNDII